MSERSFEERMADAKNEFEPAVMKLPPSDGARITVTKRSVSAGTNSKGHVMVFRDSATKFKYTVSVNVAVASAKLQPGDDASEHKVATPEDIACFEDKIAEFLNSIQNEIK